MPAPPCQVLVVALRLVRERCWAESRPRGSRRAPGRCPQKPTRGGAVGSAARGRVAGAARVVRERE